MVSNYNYDHLKRDVESSLCCRFLGEFGIYCPLLRKDCDQNKDWSAINCQSYKQEHEPRKIVKVINHV